MEELKALRPVDMVTMRVPAELLKQFQQELRIVIKWPGLIGIPIPDVLLNRDLIGQAKDFEAMLVPREFMR